MMGAGDRDHIIIASIQLMDCQHRDLLELVSEITQESESLREQLSTLHQNRDDLTMSANRNIILPNDVLTHLIALLDTSTLEFAPVRQDNRLTKFTTLTCTHGQGETNINGFILVGILG